MSCWEDPDPSYQARCGTEGEPEEGASTPEQPPSITTMGPANTWFEWFRCRRRRKSFDFLRLGKSAGTQQRRLDSNSDKKLNTFLRKKTTIE
jgi:hypothetical protein